MESSKAATVIFVLTGICLAVLVTGGLLAILGGMAFTFVFCVLPLLIPALIFLAGVRWFVEFVTGRR